MRFVEREEKGELQSSADTKEVEVLSSVPRDLQLPIRYFSGASHFLGE